MNLKNLVILLTFLGCSYTDCCAKHPVEVYATTDQCQMTIWLTNSTDSANLVRVHFFATKFLDKRGKALNIQVDSAISNETPLIIAKAVNERDSTLDTVQFVCGSDESMVHEIITTSSVEMAANSRIKVDTTLRGTCKEIKRLRSLVLLVEIDGTIYQHNLVVGR